MDCVVLIMGKLYIQMVVSGEEQLRSCFEIFLWCIDLLFLENAILGYNVT